MLTRYLNMIIPASVIIIQSNNQILSSYRTWFNQMSLSRLPATSAGTKLLKSSGTTTKGSHKE